MNGLLTASRRCRGRLWGSIALSKSNYNILFKAPLCSPFFAATTLHTNPTPWTTPIITPSPLVTYPAPEIIFFDLETTFPRMNEKSQLLEFGAVVLCAHTLEEKGSYSSPIRPSLPLTYLPKKMRDAKFSTAPSFAEVAPEIFDLLHGRIWAGHNMKGFDARIIRNSFHSIGQIPPQDAGIIDTLPLLRNRLPLPNNKLATITKYLNVGVQKHRSLPDARLTIDVLMRAATLFFLSSKIPALAPPPDELVRARAARLSTTLRDAKSKDDTPRKIKSTVEKAE